jgi:hypothetical protein
MPNRLIPPHGGELMDLELLLSGGFIPLNTNRIEKAI